MAGYANELRVTMKELVGKHEAAFRSARHLNTEINANDWSNENREDLRLVLDTMALQADVIKMLVDHVGDLIGEPTDN